MSNSSEIILYTTPAGTVKVEVILQDETVWLTQKAMGELFGVQRPAITKHLKNIFESGELLKTSVAILNSSLYYWYYIMHSDARTNNPSDLKDFPIDFNGISLIHINRLKNICKRLMIDIDNYSVIQNAKYRTGQVKFQQFFPQKSKPIIDEIDKVLAEYYGFTEEELDFIINYDIKYRMGKELEKE